LMEGFAHLHVRSGFSYGFGIATPEELVEDSGEMGVGSVALTDRNGLYGIPRLLKAAEEVGVGPIVGAEVSMEGGGHLVLLIEDAKGYRSLSKLITSYRCSSEDRRKPQCPLLTLLDHAEGLICLTGAVPFGLLPHLVLSGNSGKARDVLDRLWEAFGRENVFVELTDDRTMGSRRRLRKVAIFAKEQGLSLLATNEVTYPKAEDHRLHEVLVAAANLRRLPGPGYRPTDQLYLKPPEKMESLFED
jgi:error-prone DNA polymerase